MKRNCLLLTIIIGLTFTCHAKVALLVVGDSVADTALPLDGYWTGSENNPELSPERATYTWFNNSYTTSQDKTRILIGSLQAAESSVPEDVDVLWINLDRNEDAISFDNWKTKYYDNIFNSNVVTALSNFVKRGGNLLLTKQAARIVAMIGRTASYPTCGISWIQKEDPGPKTAYTQKVVPTHKIFADTGEGSDYNLVSTYYPTFRESLWDNLTTDEARSTFETNDTCKILGYNDNDNKKAGIVEFYPKGDYQGTVLVIGVFGYQWCPDAETPVNTYLDNVKQLTQNALDYLTGTSELTVSTPSANPVICAQEDITVSGDYLTPVSYATTNANVANIHADGHIYYNHFGEVTFTVHAAGDGIHIPKNTVSASVTRTVTGGAPAPFAYVLPYSLHVVSGNTYDDSSHGNIPDYLSAKWFYDTYVDTGKGCFIRPTDYSSSVAIPSVIKVLWVHNDHVGQDTEELRTAFGGDNFVAALQAFINRGGNVFLSKQATRLVGDLQRLGAGVYPSFGNGGYLDQAVNWGIKNKFFGTLGSETYDLSTHPVYTTPNNLGGNPQLIDATNHTWRTNNNCVLFGDDTNNTEDGYLSYQTTHNCRLLGCWDNSGTSYQGGVFAEFYPQSSGQGTIIMLGAAAYQWTCGVKDAILDNVHANVKNLTQNILEYLAPVIVTKPGTEIPSTVSNLVIYQGGSVSNTGDITVTHSITYIRPAVDGAAGNELGHWYTFCLPFDPSHCYVYEEGDQDYEINSVYLSGEETESNPLGEGSFYLQTFAPPAGWAYIGGEGKPHKDEPYIIKFLNATEDNGKGSDLAAYFTDNPTIMFVGGPQGISGTDDGTGGTPNGDYSYHVNHTLRKLTMSHVYPLNTATNMFEYDYGGPSEIMPFECYIKASTPALAAARPRFAIGRGAQQGTEITTAVETVAAPLQPLRIYDITGRLFHIGDEPRQLPQGIWIVRQGEKNRTIVIP